MATQIGSDGSDNLFNNVKTEKNERNLKLLTTMTQNLTEPEVINKIIDQMLKDGVLNEFDLMKLKSEGIYHEEIAKENVQDQSIESINKIFGNKDLTIDGNDEIDEMEL